MSMQAAEPAAEEVNGLRQTIDDVRASFHSEDRFLPDRDAVYLSCMAGSLVLEGDVHDLAVKRLLVGRAAAHPNVASIVDRLRVAPSRRMGEAQIRAAVRDALLDEPMFADTGVREYRDDGTDVVHRPAAQSANEVAIRVEGGGVVFLEGEVPSLAHKRLAGVLAWWVPGCRDVVNLLGSESFEEDRDEEITRAVRMVLDKDPAVDTSQVRIEAKGGVVTLHGLVTTSSERAAAERDAWYVLGVTRVVNEITTRDEYPALSA